jgi:hypothetical protein
MDEVLQGRFSERHQLDHDASGQKAGVEREVAATETWCAAQSGRDVPDRREVRHLLDRHAQDDLLPARHGFGFFARESVVRSAAQAERCVQVRAHQGVLELRGLVQRVHQRFAAGDREIRHLVALAPFFRSACPA